MMCEATSLRKPLVAVLVAMFGTAFVTVLLSASTDIAESLWHFTRSKEGWEVDEVLMATSASAIIGLIVAMVQISSLTQRVAKLDERSSDASARLVAQSGPFENIVKCTFCSKFQLGHDQWLDDVNYITQRCDASVIGGLCPSCSKKQPS